MAPRRQKVIAKSVQSSILHSNEQQPGCLGRLPAYFYSYWLTLDCVREDLFQTLRGTWDMDQDGYRKSFTGKGALKPMGDMGYSGSTFFMTHDGSYIVKSVPRYFEHSFFRDDLLLPYADYMNANPDSLLVRITDFLQCSQHSIGTLLGLAPSHHMVMENIKHGQDRDESVNKWESWDLKPMSYFYPERDVAGGALSSEATKSKLADEFHEKVLLTLDQAEGFKAQLQKDTQLLSSCNAVDYSLFLIRIPSSSSTSTQPEEAADDSNPFQDPSQPNWRTGVPSADGKYVYRAALLDFFWAKHKLQAKAMTGLINTYRAVDAQGPMSVTTDAREYRERFLTMCREMVEIDEVG